MDAKNIKKSFAEAQGFSGKVRGFFIYSNDDAAFAIKFATSVGWKSMGT
jgi:hypothetical protein